MSIGQLAAWCLDNETLPDELDQPFVIDYNIFLPDDAPEDRRGDYEEANDVNNKNNLIHVLVTLLFLKITFFII